MGFLSGFGSWVRDTVDWVKEKVKDTARKVKEFFTGGVRETSNRTAEEKAYDEMAATLAETKRINSILSDFSLKLADYADELESNAIEESGEYFNSLIEALDQNKSNFKVNTAKIKRNKVKVERQIRGSFKKHLSKRVSLDDWECLSILKLDAGEEKRKRMNSFGNKVLMESANNLCIDIKESLLEQQEYIEECLDDKMNELIRIQHEMINKFDELEIAYEDGKDRIDEEKSKILSKVAICELALSSIVE